MNLLYKWCKNCNRVTEWLVNKSPHTFDYGLALCKECGFSRPVRVQPANLEQEKGEKSA